LGAAGISAAGRGFTTVGQPTAGALTQIVGAGVIPYPGSCRIGINNIIHYDTRIGGSL